MGNVLWMCIVAITYIFMFAVLPFWICGHRFSKPKVVENLLKSFLVSHLVLINVAFLLLFLQIYNTYTLIVALLLVIAAYVYFFKRESFIKYVSGKAEQYVHISKGVFSRKVISQEARARRRERAKAMLTVLFARPVNVIVFLIGFGFAAYTRCYFAATQMHYGLSDTYVSTSWMRLMEEQKIFTTGVYPYGMHVSLESMKLLSGIDLITILRFMGCLVGLVIVIMLYILLRRAFRSSLAANFAFIIFCVSDAIFQPAVQRQSHLLAQEYAQMFLYPCAYFLHDYLETKKRS